MSATPKQVSYAMSLLRKAGYSLPYMDSGYKALGAKMAERSGTVERWLGSMSKARISGLIDELLGA